ncbi:MAG: hypothetical protein ABJA66_16490, partial [Actinomycetota bacterium]
ANDVIESGNHLIKKGDIVVIEKGANEYKLYLRGGHTISISMAEGEELWNEWKQDNHPAGHFD